MSRTEDSTALREVGRASIQIVHDLKNQLNGLKLYATFLRKRIEKSDRPGDELETINKLIGGLDRAAADLSTISQYTQEIELKKQEGFDLQRALRGVCSEMNAPPTPIVFEANEEPLIGVFDPLKLTDTFRWISLGVIKHQPNSEPPNVVKVFSRRNATDNSAVIEWSGCASWDHDPFRSFAGTDEIRMSLAAKIVDAHGGSVRPEDTNVIVTLPL